MAKEKFMKRLKVHRILLLAATLLMFVATALGQTAQVTGRISDPSGAVVPDAQITITNQQTGLTRNSVSNSEGNYTLPLLPPGEYRLAVKKEGFKPVVRPDIVLNVEQVARLDFTLEAGAVTDTVTITSDAPLLNSETSSVGQVVDNKTVVTLPLNGRNYTQLAVLMPGATPQQGSRTSDGFVLNGQRAFQNTFRIDGIDNNNYILGVQTNSSQALRPSVDAIQEFKVESANFSAEYGNSAGGIITLAIKSGTNEIHGSAFEFLRNDKLDANDFFANRAGIKRAPLRYNQFGGAVGGPIWRNHTFFFGSYQGTRDLRSPTTTVTVPTPEMVRGIFGTTNIYDPANVVSGARVQFANNTIPEARIDPVGRRIAALYPAPNQPGTINNYVGTVSTRNITDQVDFRADHNVSQSDTMFFRLGWSKQDITNGRLFAAPGNGNQPTTLPPRAFSLSGGETHSFSATLFNELRFGYVRNKSDVLPLADKALFDEFGIKGIPPLDRLTGLSNFAVTNFATLGDRAFTPNPKLVEIYQMTDSLSWNRGVHALKFGGEWRFKKNYAATANASRGTFTFNGQFTSRVPGTGAGSAIADLLLGLTSNASLSTLQLGDFRDYYVGFYGNDTWRVTPKLTLNLGLRYDIQSPIWEVQNRQGNFDFTPGSPTYGTVVVAKDGGTRARSFVALDKNNFAPRVGFAYQFAGRNVLSGAFGVFYGGLGYLGAATTGIGNSPFSVLVTRPSATTAAASSLKLSNGFPAGILDPRNVTNPSAVGVSEDSAQPVVYQWNLTAQHELPGQTVFSVAYVGSSSRDLKFNNDINAPAPGAGAVNPRRPFPTFGAITYFTPQGRASYHSLQAKAERRFSKGFSLLSSYTLSHAIDNTQDLEDVRGPLTPQNPRDIAAEKASAGIDVRHRSITSVIYDLPLGRKDGWLGGHALSRALLGGWQLGGIFVAQTGFPMTPIVNPNPANTTTTARPDRLRDGNLSRGERTIDRWYDVSAFQPAAQFTFGNSGRNVLRAPGLVNLDLLVGRNFAFSERKRLELRGEFFNATNSVHFGQPGLNIRSAQAGRITATQMPNRQIQLGLRFAF
jgi:hypothetical protein